MTKPVCCSHVYISEYRCILGLYKRLTHGYCSIGPTRARKLADQGHRTLADLETAKLDKGMKIGLRNLKYMEMLIPRKEMDQWKDKLMKSLAKLDPDYEGEILGSYRRGEPWSSDIDLVIRYKGFDGTDTDMCETLLLRVVHHLRKARLLYDDELACGVKRWTGLCRLSSKHVPRRLDIRLVPSKSYHCMLLGSTGDLLLMKKLRGTAKSKGLHLNEYGFGHVLSGEQRGLQKGADMYDPDRMIEVNSEEDIFKRLGYPYIPPEKRSYQHWKDILR